MEELSGQEKKSGVLKRVGKLLLWLLAILLFILGSLAGLLVVYEKEIKGAILTELNKHLLVKVKVAPENIDLTIIKTFPDCALQFKNVLVLDALPEKKRDTLLSAGLFSLRFNAKDIWNKKYKIHTVSAENGLLRLRILKDGTSNYTFWKSSAEDTGSTDFDLDKISMSDFHLQYKNSAYRFLSDLQIRNLTFSGKFRATSYDLNCQGDFRVNELLQDHTPFLRKKNVNLDFSLAVEDSLYSFTKADLRINDLFLKLNGSMVYTDDLQNARVMMNAKDLEIGSVLSLLPQQYSDIVHDYSSSGKLYLNCTFDYRSEKQYALDCAFGIDNGSITYKPGKTSAENVNLAGTLHYSPDKSLLQLKKIKLRLKEDVIQGECQIDNFSAPKLTLAAAADLHLSNLQSFWPIDTLSVLEGQVQLNTKIQGLISDLTENTFGPKVNLVLDAKVKDLKAQFKSDAKMYAVPNCIIAASEGEVRVTDLELRRGQSQLTLNGRIPGLFNYLTDPSAPLIIIGTLDAPVLCAEDFMSASSTTVSEESLIPEKVNFKLEATISEFSFGKFHAEDISGDLEIRDQKLLANDIRLKTLEGATVLNGFIDNSKHKLVVTLQAEVSQINIQELFRQMNNFGQTTLEDKNIRGLASASIDVSGIWSNALVADENALQARCQLLIERGQLVNFEPLKALSRFVEVKDLNDIRFSALQSTISIKNSQIIIPATSIKNSALNIDLWGTHGFDNVVDYHFRLLISELLNKKRTKALDEFGAVEDDPDKKRMAYVRMTGPMDKLVIRYDKQGMKQKVAADLKSEKQSIKQILREELGLFRKDSLPKKTTAPTVFEIEENTPPPVKKTLELKKKKEDDDF